MNRRQRLQATLAGKPVDRPPVSFYEIGMRRIDTGNPDPFNIHNDPSWKPLAELAEAETDIMRNVSPASRLANPELYGRYFSSESWTEGDSRFTRLTVRVGKRTLTQTNRRDREVQTSWIVEHLLKDVEELDAYLEIPDEAFERVVDCTDMARQEEEIGDAGIALLNTADPICVAAALFSMADYTMIAFSENERFHRLLRKIARWQLPMQEAISAGCPGQLWRICGPEYAGEPYLPPSLFAEYVVAYDQPISRAIRRHAGFVRLHSHGNLRNILPLIEKIGIDGLDPIEPPPQGDVELIELREAYGDKWVLFGNIEASDIENLNPADFALKVRKALEEGTSGGGRGFVLHPSASPYGRKISPSTLENYKTMVRLAQQWHK